MIRTTSPSSTSFSPEIEAVAKKHARRYAVVPLLEEEPVGVDRLLELSGHVAVPAGG